MIYGAEYFARKHDIPVVYYEVIKERIGHYKIVNQIITEKPTELENGGIIKQYTRLLEETIRRQPEFWLWSHRRWKHKVNLEDCK